MKPLAASKSRLSSALSDKQRMALALNMVWHVLRAAVRAPLEHVWVVGGDPDVRRLAESGGACWRADTAEELNATLADAFDLAFHCGLAPLYLPGDLPLLESHEVQGLISASRHGANVVLSPDVRGDGTNALLLPVGSPLRPSLGPGSFPRHLELARSLGLKVAIYHSPGLSFDLDIPEDLASLEVRRPGLLGELVKDVGDG